VAFSGGPSAHSDELRIYDDLHGRLTLALSFRPTERYRLTYNIGKGRRHTERGEYPYAVTVLNTSDVNGDGGADILATFDQVFADGISPHPALIWWNASTGGYSISPLLRSPDDFAPLLRRYKRGDWAQYAQAAYKTPDRIFDQTSGRAGFKSYSGEVFEADRAPQAPHAPRLVGGFAVAQKHHADAATLQVFAWTIAFFRGAPGLEPCSAPGFRSDWVVVAPQLNETYPAAIQRAAAHLPNCVA
jgi:hypothetical protein